MERQLSDQLCACGCGLYTYIAHYSTGRIRKGEALTYRKGHSGPPPPISRPRFTGDGPNPSGLCMCGCGRRTEIAKQTRSERGEIQGKPKKYVIGHRPQAAVPDEPGPNPSGFCMCGCGARAPLALRTSRVHGLVKGKPIRYIKGHHRPWSFPLCACGCGEEVKRRRRKYIDGHALLPEVWEADPETGCWNWTGGIYTKTGRPRWGNELAYQRIYVRDVGPITKGIHLHHTCENPMCVNPAHLEPLTPAEHAERHKMAA